MTDVGKLLTELVAWAGDRPDIRGLALVGSHAHSLFELQSSLK
ncbi:hypothetical protein ACFLU6_14825 [Acidobacteriota bacterium]